MSITATEAKNRFGYFCAQAKTAPVVIEKDGRPDSVIVSFQDFQALQSAAAPKSMAQRKREFDQTYKDWIDAQVDKYGIPGEEFRPW